MKTERKMEEKNVTREKKGRKRRRNLDYKEVDRLNLKTFGGKLPAI